LDTSSTARSNLLNPSKPLKLLNTSAVAGSNKPKSAENGISRTTINGNGAVTPETGDAEENGAQPVSKGVKEYKERKARLKARRLAEQEAAGGGNDPGNGRTAGATSKKETNTTTQNKNKNETKNKKLNKKENKTKETQNKNENENNENDAQTVENSTSEQILETSLPEESEALTGIEGHKENEKQKEGETKNNGKAGDNKRKREFIENNAPLTETNTPKANKKQKKDQAVLNEHQKSYPVTPQLPAQQAISPTPAAVHATPTHSAPIPASSASTATSSGPTITNSGPSSTNSGSASTSSGPTADWDSEQVNNWASNQFSPDLAAKLKAKGVRGRKLFNWKDTFPNDPSGLRKQLVEFLQLPESLEADADDFAFSVVKLK